jgi:CheY-like chemotaxis protein
VEALQSVLHDQPDVIVLDLAMPRITGWEVLKTLKRDPRTQRIPVLVLSGQRERESAILAGADGYCEKPCLPAALVREIQKILLKSVRHHGRRRRRHDS